MSTPGTDRQDLVRNAVAYLADKTQASPLTHKIQFLEGKGLTQAEIDAAVKQWSMNQGVVSSYSPPYAPVYGSPPYSTVTHRRWDWRDYFIIAVVSGTVTYSAVELFKKYLLPHLQPPTSTAYEGDRDALTAQFDAAEDLLKEIQAETAAVRAVVEEQKEKVDKTTQDVDAAVKEMREGENRTRDEMREIRDEVNNVRDMLPKMIEKNKESQTQSLTELHQELKSLKALLLSRGPSQPGTPSSSLPSLTGRPTIPAWQLLDATNGDVSTGSAPAVSSPILGKGKGKEADIFENKTDSSS